MAVKFCEKCGAKMELTDRETKWVKVCKDCYAKEKQAEDQANGLANKVVVQEHLRDRVNEVTAGRIARSTGHTNAVALVGHLEVTPFVIKKVFDLAEMNAQFILTGNKPDIVLEEKIDTTK